MAGESLILDSAIEHPSIGAYRALIQATSGLVGYWPLDDLASPYRDLVAGNSATDATGAGVSPRRPGVLFNGSGRNRLRIPHSAAYPKAAPNDPNVFSISFWANWPDYTKTGALGGVVATDESWTAFAHLSSLTWVMAFHKFLVDDLAYVSYAGNDRTGWHHYAMTAGGVTGGKVNAKIYLDGALAAEADSTNTFANTSSYIALGNSENYNEGFVGTLAEFAYFNVALTAAQVLAQYRASAEAFQGQLDLSDNVTFFVIEHDYPPPDLDPLAASSVDTEGEIVVQSRYKNREIAAKVRARGNDADDIATQVGRVEQKAAKLAREGGTLQRIAPSGDAIVFDVVAASADVTQDKRYVSASVASLDVKLACRPFGRGPAVTLPDVAETILPALTFTVGGVQRYSQAVLADAPLLYWRLGESSGTDALDSSGASNEGTYVSSPPTYAGAIEGDADLARDFDGSADYATAFGASAYNPFTVAASRSFEAWVYRDATGSLDTIFGGHSASATPCVCRLSSASDTLTFYPQGIGSASWSSTGITVGAWHHVVVTFDNPNNSATLYVDGACKGAVACTDDFAAITQSFIVGAWVQSGTVKDYFDGKIDEVAVYAGVLSQDQVRAHYVAGFAAGRAGVKGDVPALGRLVIDEDQGQNQWTALWGVQSRYYSNAASAALLFEAEGLTLQGAGAATSTAASGYSGTGSVLANTLATSYQSILDSQASGGGAHWSHVGDFRVYARVQAPAANTGVVSIAARWTTGDGRAWTTNAGGDLSTSLKGSWVLADLGLVSIPKAPAGTQRWELQVLAKSTVAGDDVHVDWLMLVPVTEGSGVVSGVTSAIDYSAFQARDEFDQTAGALAGKTPNTGGNWAGAGDADDFSVSGSGTATRTAVSDSAGLGNARLATMATPASLAGLWAQVAQKTALGAAYGTQKHGLLLRYTDTSNFLAIVAVPAAGGGLAIEIIQRLAGVDTTLAATAFGYWVSVTEEYQLAATVGADGVVYAQVTQSGATETAWVTVTAAVLATGGTLASGKVGLIDWTSSASAGTRTYGGFYAFGVNPDCAVPASQSLEIRHDRVIREDSGGTLWVPPSSYKGDYLLVPPAGREGRSCRVIVKLSRGAVASGPDSGIDDVSARLTYTPRYLVVPEP